MWEGLLGNFLNPSGESQLACSSKSIKRMYQPQNADSQASFIMNQKQLLIYKHMEGNTLSPFIIDQGKICVHVCAFTGTG